MAASFLCFLFSSISAWTSSSLSLKGLVRPDERPLRGLSRPDGEGGEAEGPVKLDRLWKDGCLGPMLPPLLDVSCGLVVEMTGAGEEAAGRGFAGEDILFLTPPLGGGLV